MLQKSPSYLGRVAQLRWEVGREILLLLAQNFESIVLSAESANQLQQRSS